VSSFAGYVAGPTGKWGQRCAGSSRTPYRYISLSFIVETGPEVLNRICEDAVGGGNIVNTGSLTVLGSLDRGRYPSDGTATRRSFRFFWFSSEFLHWTALRKKQRLRSDLESVQPARCRLCPSAWSSGIGAPIFHCRLCGRDGRDSARVTLVSWGGCPSPADGRGTAGSRDGLP
jgi:hypothetical protein